VVQKASAPTRNYNFPEWLFSTPPSTEGSMPIKLILESVGAIAVLICFAIAAQALIKLRRLNRAEKLKAAVDAMPQPKQPLRRVG
jgi:hypothetical protein